VLLHTLLLFGTKGATSPRGASKAMRIFSIYSYLGNSILLINAVDVASTSCQPVNDEADQHRSGLMP